MLASLFTKYPALVKSWAQNAQILKFPDTPWTPFQGQVNRSRLALITTGGIHLDNQAPFNMRDPAGDPSFREIPADTPPDHLVITHNYYDHSDAQRDINIVFPLEGVQLLKQSREIGDVNHRHFSFMGHITNHHVQTLINDTAPRVVAALKEDGVDIVILTPAWGLCNQSVGLIQRVIEAAGMATISITLSIEVSRKVKPPRALYPALPLGHPLGFPGQSSRQLHILRLLLRHLTEIDSPGTIVELDLSESDDATVTCAACWL